MVFCEREKEQKMLNEQMAKKTELKKKRGKHCRRCERSINQYYIVIDRL